MSLFTSLSTRTPPSKRRLASLSVNFLLAMNAYKTWRPYCKMPTADFPSRIRSSRHNCKLSRRDWIRHAVSLLVKHQMCLVEFNNTFNYSAKGGGVFTTQLWPYCEAFTRRRRRLSGNSRWVNSYIRRWRGQPTHSNSK